MEQNQLKSKMSWSDFKLNSDGMVPVIVQDYKTDEVLMLAYMNEESYLTTLKLGKMTYWSRSRNELWTKGLTSGHVQYVKSLTIDCDNDTILETGHAFLPHCSKACLKKHFCNLHTHFAVYFAESLFQTRSKKDCKR